MNKRLAVVALLSGILSIASAHADQVIAKKGNWVIHKEVDSMTDKVSCAGYYQNRPNVQLNDGIIYFSARGKGGVDGFFVRVDNNPAQTVLPNDIEKSIGVAAVKGGAYNQALNAKRLRVQILTLLSTSLDFDINLAGIKEARAVLISNLCK